MSEPDKPKRKFWQIHLLTAVVVMVQVGWLIPALIDTYHYMNSVFIIGAGFGCFLVAVTTVILELCLRRLKRRILQFVVALLIVLTVALAAQLGKAVLSVVVISQNHQRATTACINFAGAEEVFHRSDYVGGGWSFYAQTLNQLYKGEGRPYASPLIDDSFSRAEFNSGVPKDGYLFKVLTAQGPHAPGGTRNYVHHQDQPPPYNTDGHMDMCLGYALIAFPSEYSVTGKLSFIVNGNGEIFAKDLGPSTTKIGTEMKEYDPDPTWAHVGDVWQR